MDLQYPEDHVDAWGHLLTFLDPRSLSRLSRTSKTNKRFVAAYVQTLSYGRRLALDGLRSFGASLLLKHAKCPRPESGVPPLKPRIEAHLATICVRAHALLVGGEETGRPAPRAAGTPTGGVPAKAIVSRWSAAELASFLVSFGTLLGDNWEGSSAAVAWGLGALELHTLRDIFILAADPCTALLAHAATGEQRGVAHLILAVRALRGEGRRHPRHRGRRPCQRRRPRRCRPPPSRRRRRRRAAIRPRGRSPRGPQLPDGGAAAGALPPHQGHAHCLDDGRGAPTHHRRPRRPAPAELWGLRGVSGNLAVSCRSSASRTRSEHSLTCWRCSRRSYWRISRRTSETARTGHRDSGAYF